MFSLVIFGCSSPDQNTNSNANNSTKPSPSPQPTTTNEEKAKQQKEADEEKQKAINEFIAKNYKGWRLDGISEGFFDCEEFSSDPCSLLISNGKQEKVISVILKRFTNLNGASRLVVYEARPIDLSQAKIERIKEVEKEAVLENLTTDDLSDSLKEAIAQEIREEDEFSAQVSRDERYDP